MFLRYSSFKLFLRDLRDSNWRERIALILFAFATFHAAFLLPAGNMFAGERAKMATGLICALSFWASCFLVKKDGQWKSGESIVSVALVALMAISCAFAADPLTSFSRGFVIASSALGGFWGARRLLDTLPRRAMFLWYALIIFTVIQVIGIVNYFHGEPVEHLLDSNPHPFVGRVMLLWFAPLTLFAGKKKGLTILGLLLLLASYPVVFLSKLISAAFMPFAIGAVALLAGIMRIRYFFSLLIIAILAVICFFSFFPHKKLKLIGHEPVFYRAENYPFSWHLAKKHPFVGIGLRTDRKPYLDDYEMKFPLVSKYNFVKSTYRTITSENTILSFMAEVGLPFTLLYAFSVFYLYFRLIGKVKKPDPQRVFPPLAIFLALTSGMLHNMLYDGIYHPQVSWFFHLLLGLIPVWPWRGRGLNGTQNGGNGTVPETSGQS